jgi:hypothetical protein
VAQIAAIGSGICDILHLMRDWMVPPFLTPVLGRIHGIFAVYPCLLFLPICPLAYLFWRYLRNHKITQSYIHPNQQLAHKKLPFYPYSIETHTKMLEINDKEFSQTVGIPFPVARYLIRHPNIIPRSNLWRPIENALILPSGYCSKLSDYDPQCIRRRLIRYSRIGVIAIPEHLIRTMDDAKRADILSGVEEVVRKGGGL